MLYGNPSASYLAEVLIGCVAGASCSEVQLVLEQCDEGISGREMTRRVAEARIDAVILPPPFCDTARVVTTLLRAKVPIAVLAAGGPPKGVFSVAIDDARAALEMTNHILDLGHRRIGFIAGDRNQTASEQRQAGYERALAQAGVPIDRALVAQGDFTYRSGLRAAERLLEAKLRPTAIFASNDDMAAAVVAVAHRKHLDVPHDLTVCGFDDTALATTISPELTTVRQPAADMARAAVGMLVGAVRRGRDREGVTPERKIFRHQIIRRQSDASIGTAE